jgi:lipopolysaccharide/colanic/teichoic acid biosynthesis glycosyltransferase
MRRASDTSSAPARSGENRAGLAAKRWLDVVVAAALLVLLSPLIAMVALTIRVAMGSPVFFRQLRPGYQGRPFELIKFRTMRPPRLPAEEHTDAERMTRLGKLLRRSSLDELPQLVNVVRGDLSLVGPRPLLMEYLPLYTREQARRHEMRPGLTGWAQVNGRDTLSFEERFAYDVWYVRQWSFWLDLQILARTLPRVISGDGIPGKGVPMADWSGNPPLHDEPGKASSDPRR